MQLGGAGIRTGALLITRRPALPTEPQLPQKQQGIHNTLEADIKCHSAPDKKTGYVISSCPAFYYAKFL